MKVQKKELKKTDTCLMKCILKNNNELPWVLGLFSLVVVLSGQWKIQYSMQMSLVFGLSFCEKALTSMSTSSWKFRTFVMEYTSGASQILESFIFFFPPHPTLLLYGERIRFTERCIKCDIPGLPGEYHKIIIVILFPSLGSIFSLLCILYIFQFIIMMLFSFNELHFCYLSS